MKNDIAILIFTLPLLFLLKKIVENGRNTEGVFSPLT